MEMCSRSRLLGQIGLLLSQAKKIAVFWRPAPVMRTIPDLPLGRIITSCAVSIFFACILNAQPSPVSVSPASGTGGSQTFTLVFNDPNGGADISAVNMYIMSGVVPGASGWSAHECIVQYLVATGAVSVVIDAGGSFGVSATSGGVSSNSQCTAYGAGSSATVSGNTLTVKLNIVFDGSDYNGTKQIYLFASNKAGQYNSNYQQQFGSWTIPAQSAVPTPVSISPSSGSGDEQVFTATFTDPNGASNIGLTEIYIMNGVVPGSASGWSGHECIVRLDPGTKDMYVVTDAGGAYSAPVSLTSGSLLQNSQCTVATSGSSMSASGNTLTVNYDVFFNTTNFSGAKQLYLTANNAAGDYTTNYQNQLASYTVQPVSQQSCSMSVPNLTTFYSIDYYDLDDDLVGQSLGSAATSTTSSAPACPPVTFSAQFEDPIVLAGLSGPNLVASSSGPQYQLQFLWEDDGDRSCYDLDCYPMEFGGELEVVGIDVTNGNSFIGEGSILLVVEGEVFD